MKHYLSEFVYGGIDGIITTFAIIAGASGGDLSKNVIIILGISSVLADGFSMGVSRYLSAKTEIEQGHLTGKNAIYSAIATFLSFVIIGSVPIIPFIFVNNYKKSKIIALVLACFVFFGIGFIKGLVIKSETEIEIESKIKISFINGFEILLLGTIASIISFFIGKTVKKMI